MENEDILASSVSESEIEIASFDTAKFNSEEEALEYKKRVYSALEKLLSGKKSEILSLKYIASSSMRRFTRSDVLFGYSAEDFVQIAILKTMEGIRKWTEEHTLKKWLLICIKSEILNTWKKYTKDGKFRFIKSEKEEKNIEQDNSDIDELTERLDFEENSQSFNLEYDEFDEASSRINENEIAIVDAVDDETEFSSAIVGTILLEETLKELEKMPNTETTILDYCVLSSFCDNKKWNVKQLASNLNKSESDIKNAIKRIKRLIKRIGYKK